MKILLVEDELDLGTTIERILNHENHSVDWFTDGREAWEYLLSPEVECDLAVLDWMVPGLSGVELCHKIRQQGRSIPILMLTAKSEIIARVQGLDAGADDYLVKPFSKLELFARIRALQRRGRQITVVEDIPTSGISLDPDRRVLNYWDVHRQLQSIPLTKKEFQILEYLIKNANKIVTTDRIRSYIWDLSADTFSNVVASHIRQIRKKLAETNYADIIETIPNTGYRLNLIDRDETI
ncbi:MAG: response regulator transcription factor [Chamaesiphon sp.]|nr:response regulator transcription factor [Chamaesiphon sp.]